MMEQTTQLQQGQDQSASPLVQAAAVAASQSSPPSGSEPVKVDSAGQPAPAASDAAKPTRPDWLPETLWDAEKGSAKAEDLKAAIQVKADLDARNALVPTKAEEYELKLPDDFKLPDGFKLDETDPRLAPLRELALAEKWTKDQFQKVIALDVKRAETIAAKNQEFVKVEMAKLGDNGAQQIDAVIKWGQSKSENDAQAKAFVSKIQTADDVKFFTRLMKETGSGGVDALNTGGRLQQQDDGKPEGYRNWSALDRRSYDLNQQQARK